MKLNINNKEVDLVINGETPAALAKKAKVIDKNLSADEIVRKVKEAKAEQENKNE